MNARLCVAAIVCSTILSVGGSGVHAQTATCYKSGETGVFRVEVALPASASLQNGIFTARDEGENLYEIYLDWSESLEGRLSEAIERRYDPQITPEQQREIEAITKEQTDLFEQTGQKNESLSKAREERAKIWEEVRKLKAANDPANAARLTELEHLEKTQSEAITALEKDLAPFQAQQQELSKRQQAIYQEAYKKRESVQEPKQPEGPAPKLVVYGRFRTPGKATLSLFQRDAAQLLAEPKLVQAIPLDLPTADGGDVGLLKQWAEARNKNLLVRVVDSPYTSYYQYAVLQSGEKYGAENSAEVQRLLGGETVGRPNRELDLYAMSTGALAIQESLQLEEMTGRRQIPEDRTVDLATLSGPTIQSHPFQEMLQGRTPAIFPVAKLVPFDNYYCHFSSLSKEIEATDLLKQWGTSLLRSATVSARDSDLPKRYMDQLCIDVSQLARLFGDLVIGEVAITGSDPFLREGSDVAVLIAVKNRPMFDTIMQTYLAQTLAANPGTQVTKSDYQGVAIESYATPDRRVNAYLAWVGEYKVHANSLPLLKRILDTAAGRGRSMAENLDFQYMRTIFPGTADQEDGFLYFSDAHIRKLLSPLWKIEEQRRVVCQNHLRMIGNAATLYRTDKGLHPGEKNAVATVEQLLAEQFLKKEVTVCPDGGAYTLDMEGVAQCSCHNRLRYCTPVSELTLGKVSQTEAQDYKTFVDRYNSYWSRYFDPIGIRFRLKDRIEVETCILPLIENSVYNQLREIIGGVPVQLSSEALTTRTIVSISAKVTSSSEPMRGLEQIKRQIFPALPPLSQCIGSNLSINLCDSDVLFTFAEEGMNMFGGFGNLGDQLFIALIASSINLPIYAVLDLKDEAVARQFIEEGLKLASRQSAAQNRGGRNESAVERYAAAPHGTHEVQTLVLRLFIVKIRLYYTMAHNKLVVSTKRYVLDEVLDALDTKASGTVPRTEANLRVNVQPPAFQQLRSVVRTGWQERMREACLKNLENVRVLAELYGATSSTALTEMARRIDGVSLRCPNQGEYRYDAMRALPYCTVHGDWNHPTQPAGAQETEGVVRFLGSLKLLSVDFSFTPEGIRSRVTLDRSGGGAVPPAAPSVPTKSVGGGMSGSGLK
jgi:hypothetical protein